MCSKYPILILCSNNPVLFIARFVEYKPTTLEKNYRHEMLTEVDLGVNIDLIDPDTYAIDPNGKFLSHFCFPVHVYPFARNLVI